MCNWSKGVREEGFKQGVERGVIQGRAEGRAEGRTEGRAEGKKANMLRVFLRLFATGMKFDEAAEIAGAETEEEIKYLREHMPA